MPDKGNIQCPCGQIIGNSSEYNLLFLKKDLDEIDILCPNEFCYLRELGFITFKLAENTIKLNKGRFYAPFVTWNATRMSEEEIVSELRQHLIEICEKHIQWNRISVQTIKRQEAPEEG